MASLPPLKRLTQEDFRDQPWIGKLLSPVNDFMSSVVASLKKGLTFSENFNAQVKELDVTPAASGVYPVRFNCTLTVRPTGLWVVGVRDLEPQPATLTSAVMADWSYENGQVVINNITGLTNGRRYLVTVVVVAG